MSIIDSLIIDRTSADVSYARQQTLKILRSGWDSLTESEQSEYLAGLKGAYNPSDLNRVTHAMEYLVERIRSYGYAVNYEKVKVPHQQQKGKSRLPAGYTELEYIESTGTQYIDTGFKPNNNTRVVMDVSELTTSTQDECLFGSRQASGNTDYSLWLLKNSEKLQSSFGNEKLQATSVGITNKRLYDKNKSGFSVNGELLISHTDSTFQTAYNLFLMCCNTAGKAQTHGVAIKLYSCQIYDNGTLVRDFAPCTNARGAVGLYDLVNGVFYGNAGTGVFAAGAEVELPSVEKLDEYTWYHSDIPQERELTAHLQNVKWLREAMVLLPNTPEVPADMEGFTFAEANDIEQILINIETIVNLMLSSIIYIGEIFSGEVI